MLTAKKKRKLYSNNSRLGYDVSKLIDEILSPASLIPTVCEGGLLSY